MKQKRSDDDSQPSFSRNELLLRAMAYETGIEIFQAELAEIQSALMAREQGPAPKERRYPPRKGQPVVTTEGKSGWPDDPEERVKEMRRRQKKARQNRAAKAKRAAPIVKLKAQAKLHPRDPEHPEHEKWLKKLRRAQVKKWNDMSEAQRQERLDKMRAGRAA